MILRNLAVKGLMFNGFFADCVYSVHFKDWDRLRWLVGVSGAELGHEVHGRAADVLACFVLVLCRLVFFLVVELVISLANGMRKEFFLSVCQLSHVPGSDYSGVVQRTFNGLASHLHEDNLADRYSLLVAIWWDRASV